jgi:hypothetical protein
MGQSVADTISRPLTRKATKKLEGTDAVRMTESAYCVCLAVLTTI